MQFQRALYPDEITHLLARSQQLDEPSLLLLQLFSGDAQPREVLNRLALITGPQALKAHQYRSALHLAFGEPDDAHQSFRQVLALADPRDLTGYLNEMRQIGFYQFFVDLIPLVPLDPSQFHLIHALLVHLEGTALWRLDRVHNFLDRLCQLPQLPPATRSLVDTLLVSSTAFQALKAQTNLSDVSALLEQVRTIPDSQLNQLINATFLLEASTGQPQLRQRGLTTRRHLPTLDPNYFYWCFDEVIRNPADPAAHAPLIGNLHTETLFNRIYVAAGLLIHGTKLLRTIDNFTYIGVVRYLFPVNRCIDIFEQTLASTIRLAPASTLAVSHQLLACSRHHNAYASPRASTLVSPAHDRAPLRTAVLCSGQARGFRETLPAILSNLVAPLQADLVISLWKDPGFPRGTHANRLSRMLPQQFAALNASGLLTDTAFEHHFPRTYQALIPDQISVADEVHRICSSHPYNQQRQTLEAWATLDVEDEAVVEDDARQRTGINYPPGGCNQFKMFYKFARLAQLLRNREASTGLYDRLIWVRPDFLVLTLDARLVSNAGPFFYTSFGSPSACGDYLLIGDRSMIDLMADAYTQGDIYKNSAIRDPYHRTYSGSVYYGGPELLARKFYQHGRAYLSTCADELRHGGLRAYSINPEMFAASFLAEHHPGGHDLAPAEAAIVEQIKVKSEQILAAVR